eukprot:TRINITY_DN76262_c0_g1_i1.p2 TRINITY_DN76262_c0_g1~~TRINITY_DN76262_c0_g1_i1.p2  ORF type:complete len:175 (-),score=44.36 TRINITY_DN76262_c0_g1_i1:135-659(-)
MAMPGPWVSSLPARAAGMWSSRCALRQASSAAAEKAAASAAGGGIASRILRQRQEMASTFPSSQQAPPPTVLAPEAPAFGPRRRRREVDVEAEAEVQRSATGSPIGLFPVYDVPRFVAGTFTGTEVKAPAALRFAITEAHINAPRGARDGGRRIDGGEEIEADEEPEGGGAIEE